MQMKWLDQVWKKNCIVVRGGNECFWLSIAQSVQHLTTKCYWCWRVRWRVTHHSECSAHCGPGVRNVTKQCEQESLQQPSVNVPVDDRHCRHLNDLPPEAEPCTGTCNLAHWQFHPWSQVLFHRQFNKILYLELCCWQLICLLQFPFSVF